jgi:hypothetical protein
MYSSLQRRTWHLVILSTLILSTGCAGTDWGSLADILAGGVMNSRNVRGEIRAVDTRRQEIELNSDWGETQHVAYDDRTQVLYGQRRYEVRNLRRGDRVRVQLASNQRGIPYATTIEVEEGIANGGQEGGQRQRLEGAIVAIDPRGGWFELQQSWGNVFVTLPASPTRDVENRFRSLRRGQYVRIEGRAMSSSRMELIRFL